jgi:methylmalonyl-CoA/ethylmalonyl-CoA epimerase
VSGVRGLAHVGVVVPELESARRLFGELLGLDVRGPQLEEELGLQILWVHTGGAVLEFVAPARDDSRAAAALARGEGGVHHVALAVEGLDALLERLDGEGVAIRDREPRRGAHGTRVSFLEPSAAAGALVELVEGEP